MSLPLSVDFVTFVRTMSYFYLYSGVENSLSAVNLCCKFAVLSPKHFSLQNCSIHKNLDDTIRKQLDDSPNVIADYTKCGFSFMLSWSIRCLLNSSVDSTTIAKMADAVSLDTVILKPLFFVLVTFK